MVGRSVRVDDVEDALARDDETVAEALAFGAWLAFWVLTSVVARDVADYVRVGRLGEDEGRRVVGFELLQRGCEIKAMWGANRQGELTENQVSLLAKGSLPDISPTILEGIIPGLLYRAMVQSALQTSLSTLRALFRVFAARYCLTSFSPGTHR